MHSTRMALIACLALIVSGCAMTPQQQKVAGIVAGVIVVGTIAAHKADHGGGDGGSSGTLGKSPGCFSQPDGTCR